MVRSGGAGSGHWPAHQAPLGRELFAALDELGRLGRGERLVSAGGRQRLAEFLDGADADDGHRQARHAPGVAQSDGVIFRRFFERNKPVAAICHGPQTLISAGLLKGRRATCYRTVAAEMKEAGAVYEDSEVVVDGNLVTSRQPSDLPAFMRETMKLLRRP